MLPVPVYSDGYLFCSLVYKCALCCFDICHLYMYPDMLFRLSKNGNGKIIL